MEYHFGSPRNRYGARCFFLLLSLFFIFVSSPAVFGGPILDPETILTAPDFGPDTFNQTRGRTACNDVNCLVVFHDSRPEASLLRYTLIDLAGNNLLPVGIPVFAEEKMVADAAVAWGGDVYLLIYSIDDGGVFIRRIDSNGALLDATPIPLLEGAATYLTNGVAVAFDGTNFLCAWHGYYGLEPRHAAASVTPDGELLAPGVFALPLGEFSSYATVMAAACGTENCLVAWTNYYAPTVAGVRLAFDGTLLDQTPLAISEVAFFPGTPAVQSVGGDYLVVWSDSSGGSTYVDAVYGARVAADGEVLDPDGFAISPGAADEENPALAFDGTNFLVAWTLSDEWSPDLALTRVTPAGVVLDSAGVYLFSDDISGARDPFLVYPGGNFLVGWTDSRNVGHFDDNTDLYAARVTPELTTLDPAGFDLTIGTRYQISTRAVFGGGAYWVVWQEENRGTTDFDIYGARLAPDGTVLDPAGIAISTAAGWEYDPFPACAATNCLVVWEAERSGYHPYAARLGFDGSVLDPDGILLSENYGITPSVASDGNNYLVVWDAGDENQDLLGVRMDATGALLEPNPLAIGRLAANERGKFIPLVAYGAGTFFVVWNDNRYWEDHGIFGTAVSPEGVVQNFNGRQLFLGNGWFRVMDIASDGENFFVVLERSMDAPHYLDIYGARITPTGEVLDPDGIPLCTADAHQMYPRVAFDGQRYHVAWEDHRGESTRVYGTTVSKAGVVSTLDGYPLSDHLTPGWGPGLAAATPNQALVAYPAYIPEAPYGETRTVARTVALADDDDDDNDDNDDNDNDNDDDAADDDATDDDDDYQADDDDDQAADDDNDDSSPDDDDDNDDDDDDSCGQ